MAGDDGKYGIDVATIHDLADPRFFIDFFEHHARQYSELNGTHASFYKGRILDAYEHARADLNRLAAEIDGNGHDAVEPDIFKRCGFICFWLRRSQPFVYALPVRQYPAGSERREAQSLFCRCPNEVFAFDMMFRVCAGYEGAVRGDGSIAAARLDRYYLNDACMFLRNKSVSPHSLYLIYRSLFEKIGN
jgi:hypothetical protein